MNDFEKAIANMRSNYSLLDFSCNDLKNSIGELNNLIETETFTKENLDDLHTTLDKIQDEIADRVRDYDEYIDNVENAAEGNAKHLAELLLKSRNKSATMNHVNAVLELVNGFEF